MIANIGIPKGTTATESKVLRLTNEGSYNQFPLLFIGKDSFIVSAKCETAFEFKDLVYNMHIGKYCAIAHDVIFVIDMNHDYRKVFVGSVSFIKTEENRIPRKGQILIQNDVWIGRGATIMGGVTIHNGAVVAANSVVTKDVAAYSIVGGNPARHIKYRFEKEIIDKLIKIQWWNWPDEKLKQNAEWFIEDINLFVDHFYEGNFQSKEKRLDIVKRPVQYLYFPDFEEKYSTWEKVIKSFVDKFKGKTDHGLILFINKTKGDMSDNLKKIEMQFENKETGCDIYIHFGSLDEIETIFKYVDFYITNRASDTVYHSCLADINNVKVISCVDIPIFRDGENN